MDAVPSGIFLVNIEFPLPYMRTGIRLKGWLFQQYPLLFLLQKKVFPWRSGARHDREEASSLS
ncbi:hypothetical protein LptCag_0182 [Leptospirillum ferriphilum]|uniref:Uncharacterized protein n=1 Tax=Leptospirillum ferriphilum TaxID=178606 RepID=A0A094X4U3_9BACT|nr:hypothetical protein LptCag_0182 [Leptospirillum ferriphilum]